MAARKKRKSREVDGFDAIRAAQKAAADRKKKPPSSEPSTPVQDSVPKNPSGSRGERFQRTVLPSRHEIVCRACGTSMEVVGRSAQTICTSCRARLQIKDLKIAEAWEGELETSGTVEVTKDGVISGGSLTCNNLILRGSVQGGTVRVTRRLTLLVSDASALRRIEFRDLEVGEGVVLDLGDSPLSMNHLDVAGAVQGHVELSGSVVIRATGDVSGSIQGRGLVVEEGGGLRAALRIDPTEEADKLPTKGLEKE